MRIIITESQLDGIKNEVRIKDIKLPSFIEKSIKSGKTSLGEHPSFPPDRDMSFVERILKKRYFEVGNDIAEIEDLNDPPSKDVLRDLLKSLIEKAELLEGNHKEELEEIVINFIYDMFNITESEIFISPLLTQSVTTKENLTPPTDDEYEYEDVDKMEHLNDEVLKRRLINALIQGSATRISQNYQNILGDLYNISPKLIELYHNINVVYDYYSFIREELPDLDNLSGSVAVNIASDVPQIHSQGVIFPVLLFQTVKGVMELLSANGLPESKDDAQYIINKADYVLVHNWDRRLGVGLWDIIMDTIGRDNFNLMPEVFSDIITSEPKEFNKIMKNVFAGTKKGKTHIKQLISDIQDGSKYHEIDKTVTYEYDKDDYFTPEDLINDAIGESTTTTSAGNYAYDAPAFVDDETADHSSMIRKSVADGYRDMS